MFWKRTTANGAFWGLISGTVTAAVIHGITFAEGKGGWLVSVPLHMFTSAMAQAFGIAIAAWSSCFVMTAVISLWTTPKKDSEMIGLVYSLTEKSKDSTEHWYLHPLFIASFVIACTLICNLMFF